MTKDKPLINFNWKFGDDESETLTLDEKEVPEGFADCCGSRILRNVTAKNEKLAIF